MLRIIEETKEKKRREGWIQIATFIIQENNIRNKYATELRDLVSSPAKEKN